MTSETVDVQMLMREVRRLAREGNREREKALRLARKTIPSQLPAAIARLKSSTQYLRRSARYLGDVPPGPNTLRAKIGAALVRILQRSMFWLLPPLRTTQSQFADALAEHVNATGEILKALEQTNIELELVRRDIAAIRAGTASPDEVPA